MHNYTHSIEIEDLPELKKAVDQIVEKYEKGAEELSVEEFKPKRGDVEVNLVALAWSPYWIVDYKERGLLHRTAIEA